MSTNDKVDENIEDVVVKIADLARLSIQSEQIPDYQKQLANIFDLVKQMKKTDTEGVEPMAHPQDQAQRMRPDIVSESDQHVSFQKIAPQVEAGLYLVPKVIERAEE